MADKNVTFFGTLNAFFDAVESPLSFESFDEGRVAAGEVAVCSDPYDADTIDGCWQAGDIAQRLQVSSSSGSGVAILGPGVAGNDSIVTGADTFSDSTRLTFAEGGVFALGLDLASNQDEDLELVLLDSKDQIIDTVFVAADSAPRFWGVVSEQPIVHLDVVSANGEFLDNVRFGPPPPRIEARLGSIDLCVDPEGNVNDIWEPGEGIQLQLTLLAVGGDFHNVAARVTSPDDGVVSLLPGVGFGDLADGNSGIRPIVVQLDSGLSCFSSQELNIEVTSAEGIFRFDRLQDIGRLPVPQDVPLELLDNRPQGTTSVLQVVSDEVVDGLDVRVEIDHPWVGDLELLLTSPAGTTVRLLDRPGVPSSTFGCSRDDMNILFSDDAEIELEDFCVSNPWFVGTALPLESLDAFIGEALAGEWQLTIIDRAPGDGGRLVDWRLLSTPPLDGQCTPCGDSGVGLSPTDIPTLGALATGVLALVLSGAGFLQLRRRRRRDAP